MLAWITLHARRFAQIQFVAVQRERLALGRLKRAPLHPASLAKDVDEQWLKEILSSRQIASEWAALEQTIAELAIAGKAGGVNPGDRRALYYILRGLRPKTMLEIGTHIGASTVHAAAALQANHAEDQGHAYHMTTVDIVDVNDPVSCPWIALGSTLSPREMVTRIGVADCVTFVTSPALAYVSTCAHRYDFVFLDGDHSARAVYQELATTLRLLNPGGVVLLHDYFPWLAPLWADTALIPGPWLGTQRLKAEGASIDVLPLGELPWQTKLNSRVTSLALLVGAK